MQRMLLIAMLAVLSLGLSGCVLDTKEPLYTEENLVTDPNLEGDWSYVVGLGDRHTCRVEQDKKTKAYVRTSNDVPAEKHVYAFFKLGDHYFVSEKNELGYDSFKVMILGDSILVTSMWSQYSPPNDVGWLAREMLSNSLSHDWARFDEMKMKHSFQLKPLGQNEHGYVRLTAPTKDLQAFVLRHINYAPAFTPAREELTRIRGIPITADGLASKKNRTFSYWWQTRYLINDCRIRTAKAKPQEFLQGLDALVKSLDDLPTLGVDLDAVECNVEAAKVYRTIVELGKDREKGGRMIEGFVRGFTGDPLGVLKEDMATEKQLVAALRAIPEKFRTARARLTSRYEMEFPNLE